MHRRDFCKPPANHWRQLHSCTTSTHERVVSIFSIFNSIHVNAQVRRIRIFEPDPCWAASFAEFR